MFNIWELLSFAFFCICVIGLFICIINIFPSSWFPHLAILNWSVWDLSVGIYHDESCQWEMRIYQGVSSHWEFPRGSRVCRELVFVRVNLNSGKWGFIRESLRPIAHWQRFKIRWQALSKWLHPASPPIRMIIWCWCSNAEECKNKADIRRTMVWSWIGFKLTSSLKSATFDVSTWGWISSPPLLL